MNMIAPHAPVPCVTAREIARHTDDEMTLHGSIHRIRRMHGFAFVLLRTSRDVLQCLYDPDVCAVPLESIDEECCCALRVRVAPEPRARAGWELHILDIRVLATPAAAPDVALNRRTLDIPLETQLSSRAVSLRHPHARAVFRVQDALVCGLRHYLTHERFTEIHTPKLNAQNAEGGANVFRLDYFGRDATLAQSPQLYKQMAVGAFERVFEIAPVFRAEKHDTARHLNEYTSVDVEMGYIDGFETLMQLETDLLRTAMEHVCSLCAEEIDMLGIDVPCPESIPSISFADAKAWIAREAPQAASAAPDLSPLEEKTLGALVKAETQCDFVFVTHYPSAKRPFYAMDAPADPNVTLSFDLLFRGMEVTTGGQRIHAYDAQVRKLRARGLDPQDFSAYLAAHRAGLPPHGGMGIGLERLTAQLCALPNVRYASLFPRDMHRLVP